MSSVKSAIERAGGPSSVAAALGVSVQAVCFWRDGKRQFPTEHGAALERLSGASVRRWDLWPTTWHLIWPELMQSPDAPAITVESGAAQQSTEVRDAA